MCEVSAGHVFQFDGAQSPNRREVPGRVTLIQGAARLAPSMLANFNRAIVSDGPLQIRIYENFLF